MNLYEELSDERGEKYRRTLASASWIQKPDQPRKNFFLELNGAPQSDTLFLETHNGDNPPIELDKFQAFYPVTRVLFKANANDEISIYYGNPDASFPRYDLSLVADQLVNAEKSAATLGAEEQMKKSHWSDSHNAGTGGIVFWGILALVVVVLLLVISRLLPKPQSP